jgi:hypothetical protein
LIFDAGPHGFLNGGHAHADALSIVLRVEGEPLFVDPGTGTYTMDPAARNQFRSSRMHNTLILNGRDHASPRGAFHWDTRADARMLVARTGDDCDFAAGTHEGHAPQRHIRAVVVLHGVGWLIVDRVSGSGIITADTWWHLHPSWQPVQRDGWFELHGTSGRRLAFASTAPDLGIVENDRGFAPEYGRIERGLAIRASRTAPDSCVLAGFVPVQALSDRPAIVDVGVASLAPGWMSARFRIRAGDMERVVSVPLPAVYEADPEAENWPQPCIEQLVTSCVE